MKNDIWAEKYRPKSLSQYVWRDQKQRQIVENWIKERTLPMSLILSGSAGVGKSGLINVILHELNLENGDVLYINASEETSVEVVRNKILGFASTIPFGDFKVCVLEEADALSKSAQNSLKRVFEDYSDNCRFIITTNNPHKIDPALHSRSQGFHIESLDDEAFLLKMAEILSDNNVDFDPDTLILYMKATYPDLRKAINAIQQNTIAEQLVSPDKDSSAKLDYMVKITDLFSKGKIQDGRKTLIAEASSEDYIEIFRYLYRNLDFWGNNDDQKDEALIIIRNGMVNDSLVADREINMAATLAQLGRVRNG
jgi:replication factor C small subunit